MSPRAQARLRQGYGWAQQDCAPTSFRVVSVFRGSSPALSRAETPRISRRPRIRAEAPLRKPWFGVFGVFRGGAAGDAGWKPALRPESRRQRPAKPIGFSWVLAPLRCQATRQIALEPGARLPAAETPNPKFQIPRNGGGEAIREIRGIRGPSSGQRSTLRRPHGWLSSDPFRPQIDSSDRRRSQALGIRRPQKARESTKTREPGVNLVAPVLSYRPSRLRVSRSAIPWIASSLRSSQ